MPRFAANLTMMFTEHPVLDRFDRAAEAGFAAVEFLFPYEERTADLRAALDRNGLELVNFNLPAGDFAAGDRGYANDPRRVAEFRDGVGRALDIAAALGSPKLNCLAGLTLADVPVADQWAALEENLAYAAEEASKAGVLQMVEPLNTFDTPGFLLGTLSAGFALVERVGHPNLKVEYDVYHAQRSEGELAATVEKHLARIGHIQIADNPGRREPGTGEINFPFLFGHLKRIGYKGFVGAEYKPGGTTEAGLGWLEQARRQLGA